MCKGIHIATEERKAWLPQLKQHSQSVSCYSANNITDAGNTSNFGKHADNEMN